MTLRCAIIKCGRGIEYALEQIQKSKEMGASLVEIPVDEYLNPTDEERIPEPAEKPTGEMGKQKEAVAPEVGTGEKEAGAGEKETEVEEKEAGAGEKEAGAGEKETEVEEKEAGTGEKEAGAGEKETEVEEKEAGDVNGVDKKVRNSDGEEEPAEDPVEEMMEIIGEEKGGVEAALEVVPVVKPIRERKVEDIKELREKSELPILFTLRREELGGRFAGDMEERIGIFKLLLDLSPAYMDFEMEYLNADKKYLALYNNARKKDIQILVTSYNREDCFSEDEMEDLYDEMDLKGPDFFSFSCNISTFAHMANLFAYSNDMKKRGMMYTFRGMGKLKDKCSIFAPLLGSSIAFCTAEARKKRGKGLIDIEELNEQWTLLLGSVAMEQI